MQDILSQKEIDEFLSSLEKMLIEIPPMQYIKPSQINQIENEEKRKELENDFASIHYLFVYPLEKLLEYITKKTGQEYYKLDYQDTCIMERTIMIEKLLEQKGYSKEQVKNLVPKTEDEQKLLLQARRSGFKDDLPCYNDYRVASASQFIQSLNSEEEVKRNIA